MSAFIKILSKFIPNIDITSPAYIYSDDSKILINRDFIAYGFLNSMQYNITHKIQTKFG